MRNPVAVTAAILSVACYFALFWGFDGLRILGSPTYGLEDSWRSQTVYWIGRWGGLDAQGLLNLAALFGIAKLAVACVCAAHLVGHIRSSGSGSPANPEILEFALLLVVALSIVTVAPAIWQHDAVLIRTCIVNLLLASIAAALGTAERTEPGDASVVQSMVSQSDVAAAPMHRATTDNSEPIRITPAA
jgi:hypothetical protein